MCRKWEFLTGLAWAVCVFAVTAMAFVFYANAKPPALGSSVVALDAQEQSIDGNIVSTQVPSLLRVPIKLSRPLKRPVVVSWKLQEEEKYPGVFEPLVSPQEKSGQVIIKAGKSEANIDLLVDVAKVKSVITEQISLVSADVEEVTVDAGQVNLEVIPRAEPLRAFIKQPRARYVEGTDKEIRVFCHLTTALTERVRIPVEITTTGEKTEILEFEFEPGQKESKPITIPIPNDEIAQSDRVVLLALKYPAESISGLIVQEKVPIRLTIVNDDKQQIQVAATYTELSEQKGNSCQLTFSSNSPRAQDLTVSLSVTGNASLEDLRFNGEKRATLILPKGSEPFVVSVTALDDDVFEGDENGMLGFAINSADVEFKPNSVPFSIEDNEEIDLVFNYEASSQLAEGESATVVAKLAPGSVHLAKGLNFKVFRIPEESTVEEGKYTLNESLFPLPGVDEEIRIKVTSKKNETVEGPTTLVLGLNLPNHVHSDTKKLTYKFLDDDSVLVTLTLVPAVQEVKEGRQGPLHIVAQLDKDVAFVGDSLEIPLYLEGSTAMEDVDFKLSGKKFHFKNNPVTVADGIRKSELTIEILDDKLAEPTKLLKLSVPGKNDHTVSLEILDDDPLPITIVDLPERNTITEGAENTSLQVKLGVDFDLGKKEIVIPFQYTGPGVKRLKQATKSPLRLTQAMRSAEISLVVMDDDKFSGDEVLQLELKAGDDYLLPKGQQKLEFSILENDQRQDVATILLAYNWYVRDNWDFFKNLNLDIKPFDKNLMDGGIMLVGLKDGRPKMVRADFNKPHPTEVELLPLEIERKTVPTSDIVMPLFDSAAKQLEKQKDVAVIIIYADPYRHEDRPVGAPNRELKPPTAQTNIAFLWMFDSNEQSSSNSEFLSGKLRPQRLKVNEKVGNAYYSGNTNDAPQLLEKMLTKMIDDRIRK